MLPVLGSTLHPAMALQTSSGSSGIFISSTIGCVSIYTTFYFGCDAITYAINAIERISASPYTNAACIPNTNNSYIILNGVKIIFHSLLTWLQILLTA